MSKLSAVDLMAYGLCLAIVVGLGALNLNFPFVADHIIALTGAKSILAGGLLYVDFWDNKMPALFWFYTMAGRCFGLNEFGVHAMELVWMLGFSLVLMGTLREYCLYPWMSGLAAVAVVGVFYATAEAFHLTQVEMLTALPLYLCGWFATRITWRGKTLSGAYALSGVMAGIVVSFKLVLAPICVVFWLVAALHVWQARCMSLPVFAWRLCLPAAVGLGTVLGAVAFKFWSDGNLAELYWTAFEYPRVALIAAPPASYFRLAESLLFFASVYLVWSLFAVLALADWWYRERHIVTSLAMAWLLAAAGVILIQRFSWWSYHFLLLFTPAGILAVRGIGVVPQILRSRGAIGNELASVLVVTLAFPAVASLAIPGEQKLSAHIDVFLQAHGDAADMHRLLNPKYAQIERSVRFLASETARPGPIYVFGDPLFYHLSGRRPALPITGWAWQYFLQVQWVQVPRQLRLAMPAYIYIDSENVKIMAARQAGVREYILSAYAPFATDQDGTWYQVRPEVWRTRHLVPQPARLLEKSP